ncbi:MAG TPA: response regulator [Candidatus Acidoferrales bacterium]|nr:response regulator [Candidatus Acidoferrales bacterium]
MPKILIAEDDAAIATVLQEAIGERLGVATHVVANGALVPDALSAERPDLIVLDLSLPGLSGLDVFDLVRNDPVWAPTPVLFLTADPEKASTASAPTGQHRVMGKPFEVDELIALVTSLLGEAEAAA